jgi:hypothetical protein
MNNRPQPKDPKKGTVCRTQSQGAIGKQRTNKRRTKERTSKVERKGEGKEMKDNKRKSEPERDIWRRVSQQKPQTCQNRECH